MSFQVTILANKANLFGIAKDVDVLRRALGGKGFQFRQCDPLEPPAYADILIHLEVPVYGWMPWGHRNIFVMNPEWYQDAWDPYMSKMDAIVVKDAVTASKFATKWGDKVICVPWAMPVIAARKPPKKPLKEGFLWVLGGSASKRAYVPTLLKAWKETYPPLLITTTTPLPATDLSGIAVPPNVSVRVDDLDKDECAFLQSNYKGHLCCSKAEGFGYTAAEAEDHGAFTILNELPVYKADHPTCAFLPSKLRDNIFDDGAATEDIQVALEAAFKRWSTWTLEDRATRQKGTEARWKTFAERCVSLVEPMKLAKRPAALRFLPPKLEQADCPRISIVTLIYNRKKFFDLACHSMMISDYPKDKIEWILVDDSDDVMEQNSDKIMAVAEKAAPLTMVYVPLKKKTPVAEKRNIGCDRATSDIILMMDDDDHYPETSFRRRVAWLLNHPWKPQATCCTTIACYDLLKGVSAVNSPPMGLPLSQRISEATLTFYKSWWEAKGFPTGVVVGEGEEFVAGREHEVLELPPQQIIVAFSHGKNVSSRRIPVGADLKVGCFWGFPKEFLVFIHGLAGVTVTGSS